MNYIVHVYSTVWRIKNQPSNSTSCSDNALHLLVLVTCNLYWGLQVTSSFSIWACILKGCFKRGIFWRAKLRLKGIEDLNLEHWWWGTWIQTYIVGPSTLSIFTVQKACKIGLSIPTLQSWGDFQEPLDFHGHISWFVCKATLNDRG